MRAKEVLQLLRITRQTLTNYVKEGIIQVNILPSGRYDYVEESVYAFLNKDVQRKTCLYARVSTAKQKVDLEHQIDLLKQFCFVNGYSVGGIYADIASGISFEKRIQFFELLDEILNHRVERVVITYKDRLSRVGFELFAHLFEKFHCKIIVMSEVGSENLDSQEIMEEIVSLLHCYSMKLYSKRRVQKIKEAIEDEEA